MDAKIGCFIQPEVGHLHHSDQGSQYTSEQFQRLASKPNSRLTKSLYLIARSTKLDHFLI
jgi:transposase InsO family protein